MDLVPLDEQRQLFISPSIDDWKSIEDHGITAVIDLDGDLDLGIPNIPNHMLYVYFPIFDEGLPDLNKLHALARLGARLVTNGRVARRIAVESANLVLTFPWGAATLRF
jgi:hypothetical protein